MVERRGEPGGLCWEGIVSDRPGSPRCESYGDQWTMHLPFVSAGAVLAVILHRAADRTEAWRRREVGEAARLTGELRLLWPHYRLRRAVEERRRSDSVDGLDPLVDALMERLS